MKHLTGYSEETYPEGMKGTEWHHRFICLVTNTQGLFINPDFIARARWLHMNHQQVITNIQITPFVTLLISFSLL